MYVNVAGFFFPFTFLRNLEVFVYLRFNT